MKRKGMYVTITVNPQIKARLYNWYEKDKIKIELIMTVIKLRAESIKAGSNFSQIVLNFSNNVGMYYYIDQCNYNINFVAIDVKIFLDGIFSSNLTGQKWTFYSI